MFEVGPLIIEKRNHQSKIVEMIETGPISDFICLNCFCWATQMFEMIVEIIEMAPVSIISSI